jgi:hypothetical protein
MGIVIREGRGKNVLPYNLPMTFAFDHDYIPVQPLRRPPELYPLAKLDIW